MPVLTVRCRVKKRPFEASLHGLRGGSLRRPRRPPDIDGNTPARLDEVLVTSRLRSRRRRPSPENENVALRKLAQVMAETPEMLVDALLNIALELCDAGSAGLSVLETLPGGEEVFRWTNLVGAMSQHVGGVTPKEQSASYLTTVRNCPQLFVYPARHFGYAKKLEPAVAEGLVLPVRMGHEKPCAIWIVTHLPNVHFDAEDVRIMTALADFTSSGLRLVRSRDERGQAPLKSQDGVAPAPRTIPSLQRTQLEMESEILARTAQLQRLLTSETARQDEERRTLSHSLHDSALQYGSAVTLAFAVAKKESDPADREAKIVAALELAERCASEIRTVSYLLYPPLLDELGLSAAISIYLEDFVNQSGIRVDLDAPEDLGRFPMAIEVLLFRIVQQGLSNVRKHSGSTSARVEVTREARGVSVMVRDAGIGISAEVLRDFNTGKHSFKNGLRGIRERVWVLSGQFDIWSNEGGTTILVTIPLA
jgi:signal transduction histidine kinase